MSVGAAEGSGRRPMPTGAAYVAHKWSELTDADAPWWAQSSGLGIRLRLQELLDLATARQQGALIEDTIIRMREEALKALVTKSEFLVSRFASAADQLRVALSASDKGDQFVPGGRNYSAVLAVLEVLPTSVLVEALGVEVARRADAVEDWTQLAALDEYVELLDAELAFDGYSREWRHEVATDLISRISNGDPLSSALPDALVRAQADWPHDVQFLFRATRVEPRATEALSGGFLSADDLHEVLRDWPDVPSTDFLDVGGFEYSVAEARDLSAALARAEDWLERQISLWRLQGGDIAVTVEAMYFDRTANAVGLRGRPASLRLLPDNLKRFESTLTQEPGQKDFSVAATLPDALIQLSQARSTARGAALADLWTVAEAVFAGSASEPRYDAGPVMAELGEFLYPLELLTWMAGRFESLGLGPRPAGTPAEVWALEILRDRATEAFRALETDQDPLCYVRAKSVASWPSGERMSEELDAVSARARRLCDRAYLVRNFFVHRAQPYRARALAVTLPVFAELLRVCLGFVAADAEHARLPIRGAKKAMLRVRACAEHYARERSSDVEENIAVLRRACGI